MEMKDWQIKQLRMIGDLIRGDWSGTVFDGRDVKRWIEKTIQGIDIRKHLKGVNEYY